MCKDRQQQHRHRFVDLLLLLLLLHKSWCSTLSIMRAIHRGTLSIPLSSAVASIQPVCWGVCQQPLACPYRSSSHNNSRAAPHHNKISTARAAASSTDDAEAGDDDDSSIRPGKPLRVERLLANLGYGKRKECTGMIKRKQLVFADTGLPAKVIQHAGSGRGGGHCVHRVYTLHTCVCV